MCQRIVELFAGIAGVSLGFKSTGKYRPVLLVDVDRAAEKTFSENFPSLARAYLRESVRYLSGPTLLAKAGGSIDGIVGCPPCQGFSEVGRRKHIDKRNHLIDHYFRLIRSVRPKFFVMENVPKILRYSRFQEELQKTSPHYRLWQGVLNAAAYGVPQTRQRAIVIGYRSDLNIEPTPPRPTHGGKGRLFAYDLEQTISLKDPKNRPHVLGVCACLRGSRAIAAGPCRPVTCKTALSDLPLPRLSKEALQYRKCQSHFQRKIRQHSLGVFNHAPWHHGTNLKNRLRKVRPGRSLYSRLKRDDYPYFSQAYSRLHANAPARTLTTNFHNPGAGRFWHYSSARTLTIREAARLQTFPDSFVFSTEIPATVNRRLVGNAFPPQMAAAIAKHIDRELNQ